MEAASNGESSFANVAGRAKGRSKLFKWLAWARIQSGRRDMVVGGCEKREMLIRDIIE